MTQSTPWSAYRGKESAAPVQECNTRSAVLAVWKLLRSWRPLPGEAHRLLGPSLTSTSELNAQYRTARDSFVVEVCRQRLYLAGI